MFFLALLVVFMVVFVALVIWANRKVEPPPVRERISGPFESSSAPSSLRSQGKGFTAGEAQRLRGEIGGLRTVPAPVPAPAPAPEAVPQDRVQAEIASLRRLSGSLSAPPPVVHHPSEHAGALNIPARWEIRYVDAFGEESTRVIRVEHLDLRRREIEAYCEARRATRSFKLKNIKAASDPRTGMRVDVSRYAEDVRMLRRARR